jgi:hypothetical protein
MVCKDRCDRWQVFLMLFVMIIPKTDFSLFVVFFARMMRRDRSLAVQARPAAFPSHGPVSSCLLNGVRR